MDTSKIEWVPKEVKKTLYRKVTKPVRRDQKVTFCYNCSKGCHDPCGLSEIYSKGSYELRNCAAFSGDRCGCGHGTEYHGHTNEITQEV